MVFEGRQVLHVRLECRLRPHRPRQVRASGARPPRVGGLRGRDGVAVLSAGHRRPAGRGLRATLATDHRRRRRPEPPPTRMNTDGKNLENVKMFERRKIKTVEVILTVTMSQYLSEDWHV